MSDPLYTDPRLSDPVERRDEALGGPWSGIVGIVVVVAFIAIILIAGVNHNRNTASYNPSPVTTGSAPAKVNPPSTTGSGSLSPQPVMPAPSRTGRA
jgi:hypothetical protein